jgi:hypothetical protein
VGWWPAAHHDVQHRDGTPIRPNRLGLDVTSRCNDAPMRAPNPLGSAPNELRWCFDTAPATDPAGAAERAVRAALCGPATLSALTVIIDHSRAGTRGLPWELHGIYATTRPENTASTPTRPTKPVTRPLLAAGTGDPAAALAGQAVPPDVYGLIIVDETADGTRRHTIVLADGTHHQRTAPSDGTLGLLEPAPPGRLTRTLSRMLGCAVERPAPHHAVTTLLVSAATTLALTRNQPTERHLAVLARIDPVSVYVRRHLPEHAAHIDLSPTSEWIPDEVLSMIDTNAALAATAKYAEATLDIRGPYATWWGAEGLAAAALDTVTDTFGTDLHMWTTLLGAAGTLGDTLAKVCTHRTRLWNTAN